MNSISNAVTLTTFLLVSCGSDESGSTGLGLGSFEQVETLDRLKKEVEILDLKAENKELNDKVLAMTLSIPLSHE